MSLNTQIFLIFLAVLLIVVDKLFGWKWAKRVSVDFNKIANFFLSGAIIDEYHKNLNHYILFLDRKLGKLLPKKKTVIFVFIAYIVIYLTGILVESIYRNVSFAPDWHIATLIFTVTATAATTISYSFTYFILRLINEKNNFNWLFLIYVMIFDIIIAYILSPFAYAITYAYDQCSKCTTENIIGSITAVIMGWPYNVIGVSSNASIDTQSLVNALLLWLTMFISISPTLFHLVIIVIDMFRLLFKTICLGFMELFNAMSLMKTPFAWIGSLILGAIGTFEILIKWINNQ